MYQLSTLPIEILYTIMKYLSTEEILLMARLNTWYGYHLSWVLGERIERHVSEEGWRIHIDILAKTYIQKAAASNNDDTSCISRSRSSSEGSTGSSTSATYITQASAPSSTKEMLLLSDFSGTINPCTLTLEFNLYPVADNGLDTVQQSTQEDRSLTFVNEAEDQEGGGSIALLRTNIDLIAYFAQISTTNRRIQHVNQAGAAVIALTKEKRKIATVDDVATLGKGFNIQYKISKVESCQYDDTELAESLRNELPNGSELSISLITFDKLHVSPEWWIKQMKIPTLNSNSSDFDSCAFASDFF